MKKRPINILLVEDSHLSENLIAELLSTIASKTRRVASGEVALEALAGGKYDVVILDIKLATYMNGFEMLRIARKRMMSVPPVIVLSRFDSFTNYRDAILSGVFDFVPKGKLDENFKEIVRAAANSKSWSGLVRHCFKHDSNNCSVAVPSDPNLVFVGIPLTTSQKSFNGIKDVVRSFGLEYRRATKAMNTGDLGCKVCALIQSCRFAVFDISEPEANVFLEIGFACASGRDVIVLRKEGTDLPLDLSGAELIEYASVRDLKRRLREYLSVHLGKTTGSPS